MPRRRVLRMAGLNITAHPHEEGIYDKIITQAAKNKRPVRYRGQDHGLIGWLHHQTIEGDTVYNGELYSFLDFDPMSPWIDLESLDGVSGEDLVKSKVIPQHLRPNFKTTPFAFSPKRHTLNFDRRHLAPTSARALVYNLFSQTRAAVPLRQLRVDIVQDEDTLDKIWGLPKLTELTIYISRPNPDDLAAQEAEIEEELDSLNADDWLQVYKSERKEGLTVTDDVKKTAQIALSNGFVKGRGRSEAKATEVVNTAEHPRIDTVTYPGDLDVMSMVIERAQQWWNGRQRRKRSPQSKS